MIWAEVAELSTTLRLTTYNIRNLRAIDWASCWLRRRNLLAATIADIDTDLWAMQEAYPSQVRWLQRQVLPASEWGVEHVGRNANRRGESVPIWTRQSRLDVAWTTTRWFGWDPDVAGTELPGAAFPRIATLVDVKTTAGDQILVANTHLDTDSSTRRRESLEQLMTWIDEQRRNHHVVVMGDLNCTRADPELSVLTDAGLRSVLTDAHGPTATNYGRRTGEQIDHVFVSSDMAVLGARVHAEARLASDHYPVSVKLLLG